MQMAHSVRQRSHWPLSRSERLDDWECKSSKWPVRLGNTGHSPATMAEDLTLKKSLELSSKRLGFQFSSAVCKSNNIFFIIFLFLLSPQNPLNSFKPLSSGVYRRLFMSIITSLTNETSWRTRFCFCFFNLCWLSLNPSRVSGLCCIFHGKSVLSVLRR